VEIAYPANDHILISYQRRQSTEMHYDHGMEKAGKILESKLENMIENPYLVLSPKQFDD